MNVSLRFSRFSYHVNVSLSLSLSPYTILTGVRMKFTITYDIYLNMKIEWLKITEEIVQKFGVGDIF